jgi:hypothetical protein
MEAAFNSDRSRRINVRKDFQEEIFYSTGSMFFPGKIKNISMGGARVSSGNLSKITKGIEIFIAIPFPNKQGYLKRKAIVRWIDNGQFGIKFNRRRNVRKSYQREASFFTDSIIFSAPLKNISMGGAQVDCMNVSDIKNGLELYAIIPFAIKQDYLTRKAIVRWAGKDQFGIHFI